MIIKNEIELHQESVDYAKRVLGGYLEVQHLEEVLNNPILHIYPIEDTHDKDGNLDGYIDALFCNIHIYDTENRRVLKRSKLYDGIIPQGNLSISQIKIFKDLSTMIVLHGKHRVNGCFQAFEISKLD